MERCEGESLRDLAQSGKVTVSDAVEILAEVAFGLHGSENQVDIRSFKEWAWISVGQLSERGYPLDILISANESIRQLPEGHTVCHGDLHLDNVMMTPKGPQLIDWANAVLAERYLDVARVWATNQMASLDSSTREDHRGESSSEFLDRFVARYASLMGISSDELLARTKPWLPIMYTRRLLKSSPADCVVEAIYELIRSGKAD